MKNKQWYEIRNQANDNAEILIYGVIADYAWDETDVTAKAFLDELRALGNVKQIDLRINSPGGSVWAGSAIYNVLKQHPANITVYIDGLAASMASVVAMTGDTVVMPANAMLMIHDPSIWTAGNAEDLRKMADLLDKTKSGLIAAYQAKTGMNDGEISDLMAAETWLTAEQAVAMGFADTVSAPVQMTASHDLSRYRNVPQALVGADPRVRPVNNNRTTKGEQIMNLEDLKTKHPDLVAQVEASARTGMLPEADITARLAAAKAEASAEERARMVALANAVLGEEAGKKFAAIIDAGLTAEQVQALGVNIAPADADDMANRHAILAGLQAAAPAALKAAAATKGDAEERKAVASAIAAGGNRK